MMMLSFSACTKSTDITNYAARPVVEGYLAADNQVRIKVTEEILLGSIDTVAKPIDGLNIIIKSANGMFLLKDQGDGWYESTEMITAGTEYSLSFNYNSKEVTAITQIPFKPIDFTTSTVDITIAPFIPGQGRGGFNFNEAIQLNWRNTDNSYYLTAFVNTDSIQTPINTSGFFFRGRRINLQRPSQLNSDQINYLLFEYYGNYNILLFHVFPEYAALYETSEASSLNLAPPPTNITNGLGIFTGIAVDSLKLYVHQ